MLLRFLVLDVADNKWLTDYRDFHGKILRLICRYVRL